jgi:prepilin-type N-terminal cleavage/methylation domain-containing protein
MHQRDRRTPQLKWPIAHVEAAGAFTLVELLVVVAIIGVLLAVLIPSLSAARESAKGVACLSNMRSLMQIVVIYSQQNDDSFPSAGLSHGGSQNMLRSWVRQMVLEHGRDDTVLRCPSDESVFWDEPVTTVPPDAGDPSQAGAQPVYRQTSYASNGYTAFSVGDRPAYSKVNLIHRPMKTVFWVELNETTDFASSDHVHPENWWLDPQVQAGQEMQLERHAREANYSLMDTHVETLTFEETYRIDDERSQLPDIVWIHNMYDPEIAR